MLKLIGIPYDGNSTFLKGPALAPQRIRLMEVENSANSFAESGKEIKNGTTYHDLGDMSFAETSPQFVYDAIKQKIKQELTGPARILCLGGDHSISFPVIEVFNDEFKDLHVLHFDAHADLYANFRNNPFSHASPFARIMEKGLAKSLTQVGIRTLNTHQKEQAEKFNVQIIAMKDLSFAFLGRLQGPLYVSLDMDVLDPAFAPGVSHHEPGGLSTRELIQMIQNIPVPIVGADIVEYNPVRDLNHVTAMVAFKLLKELISKIAESMPATL